MVIRLAFTTVRSERRDPNRYILMPIIVSTELLVV